MRSNIIGRYQTNPNLSVLIIGGGINGIGTFRDLALQGVDVLVVDRADFCSGTSSASSHMIHGGIRYLENGEFRLVKEAVKERNRLLRNAPQYVQPLATTIPIFKWGSGLFNAPMKFLNLLDRPAERGALVIKAGLTMYDAYTLGQKTVPKHDFDLRRASLRKFPDLNPDIVCTATYYDAAMPSPERICIEVMRDGVQAGGDALNYVSAVGTEGDGVLLRDELTGETFAVRPQLVINAAGPWIDFANGAIGRNTQFIGGTKGSHLVLDHPQLHKALRGNEIFFENEDGRIVLIYPLLHRVLIGTTDIPIDHPDEARCTDDEIDYLLEMVDNVFPNIAVDRSHILFRFSGVRPLPRSDTKSAGQISRDHSIRILDPTDERPYPIWSLIGGKWTTFRAFADEVTDKALWMLGRTRRIDTKDVAIGGGVDYPQEVIAQAAWVNGCHKATGITLEWATTWFNRYGTRAREIADFSANQASTDQPLTYHPAYSQHEIAYLVTNESVIHLDDLILRRSLIGMLGETTLPLVEELAQLVGSVLGWRGERISAEIARTRTIFADRHQVSL